MIRYLSRQFGLIILGLCIISASLPIAEDMHRIHQSVKDADRMVRDVVVNQCAINKYAGAINASQLQPARYVKLPAKPALIKVAAWVKK